MEWCSSFLSCFLFPLLCFQCCDLGYHASLNRALRTYLSAEYNLETSRHEGLDIIENAVDSLEPRSDKQRFMEMYPAAFCPPMKFEFQSHMGDEVCILTSIHTVTVSVSIYQDRELIPFYKEFSKICYCYPKASGSAITFCKTGSAVRSFFRGLR